MKQVIMLHTHNTALQRQILTKDLNFDATLMQERPFEMTDRELAGIKGDAFSLLAAKKVAMTSSHKNRRAGSGNRSITNTCRNCGDKFTHPKEDPCRATSEVSHMFHVTDQGITAGCVPNP